jgi:hypothetical protein
VAKRAMAVEAGKRTGQKAGTRGFAIVTHTPARGCTAAALASRRNWFEHFALLQGSAKGTKTDRCFSWKSANSSG